MIMCPSNGQFVFGANAARLSDFGAAKQQLNMQNVERELVSDDGEKGNQVTVAWNADKAYRKIMYKYGKRW